MQVAFYKGKKRLFNRLVAWWTQGPYSHCELVIDGVCWSSSFMDGGVRNKVIAFDADNWDLVPLAPSDAADALAWFAARNGQRYDVLGIIGFIWRALEQDQRKWFCSEAIAAALGIPDAWRFDPNTLHAALQFASANDNLAGGGMINPTDSSNREAYGRSK